MDEIETAIRRLLKTDFIHYAEKCLKIRTKRGGVRPFRLNRAQRYIHEQLEQQLAETGRVRALVLKGRQQGCSTYVEGRFYWKVTHSRGMRAFILTHLDEATRNIYSMVRRFHAHCPAPVKAATSVTNAKELVFDALESGYRVGTAKSQGTGRSDTLQYFHGSEVAYWANAEAHVSGALQAVPDAPGTEIILESTSDGPQGQFYRMCMAARDGVGAYRLIFVPWHWQDEYSLPAPDGFEPDGGELEYIERHGLTHDQLCWRRAKIAELGGIWAFRREYPATVEEAFHSDRPGALWTRSLIERNRVPRKDMPEMRRIVVAVDPAVSSGVDGHGYVLADRSGRYTPAQWAAKAVAAYHEYAADRIVAETNQGGDMVAHTIRACDPSAAFKAVHASSGKRTRAEPVAALDEQGRIHHAGLFAALEDQMCGFAAGSGGANSPDRVDARVWAFSELMLGRRGEGPRAWRV